MDDEIEQLRKEFRYDPETGQVFRLVGHTVNGYTRISISPGKFLQAHRLGWALFHGEWPVDDIDHINGVRDDNRLANLRDVTNVINRQNERKARKNSKSGLLGASWSKAMGRWVARIHHDGKHHFLGHFDTAEEAHAAYLAAKRIKHAAGCTI